MPAAIAYVANARSHTVIPISTVTGARGPAITVHGGPSQITITPDGTAAYVVALENIPRMPGIVLPISTVTGTAGPLIHVGNEPLAVAFTP